MGKEQKDQNPSSGSLGVGLDRMKEVPVKHVLSFSSEDSVIFCSLPSCPFVLFCLVFFPFFFSFLLVFFFLFFFSLFGEDKRSQRREPCDIL